MPYQKLVTVYSPHERRILHSQGVWIDRNGVQLPVRNMDYSRLNKLVNVLSTWAFKEDRPYDYLRSLPIFPHVLLRIREVGLRTVQAYNFENAYKEVNDEILYYL